MDYHRGGTLEQKASLYAGCARNVLENAMRILEGLGRLHQKSVIHRDIKAANIFLGRDDRWILGDLGIVLPVEGTEYTTGERPRSKDWAPTWLIKEHSDYDARYDLFMLVRVMHFALLGGVKMEASSWIEDHEAEFDVSKRFPEMPLGAELHRFFLSHLRARKKDDFPTKTTGEMAARLRRLLRMVDGEPARLVWSMAATTPQTAMGPGSDALGGSSSSWTRGSAALWLAGSRVGRTQEPHSPLK
jgi:serine/threonine protein kinase